MKTIQLFIMTVISLTVLSCSDQISIFENQQEGLINFEGIQVKHGKRSSLALTTNLEDYKSEYLSKFSISNGKTNATLENVEYPTLDFMAEIEEEEMTKYPDVHRMDDSDLELIRNDFPTLSDEQIALNIEIIEKYYDSNLQFDVFQHIISTPDFGTQTANNERAMYYPGGLCNKEFWYLFGRPTAASAVKKATDKTWEFVDNVYRERTGKTRSDAFRHAMWNALIAKYYAGKKKSIDKGIDLAKGFTNRHEECNADQGSPSYDQEMDYHNNHVGRDYFKGVGKIKRKKRRFWFTKKWLEAPSDESMKNSIKFKADIAVKVSEDLNSVRRVSSGRLVYFR
ncbi:DUF6973 domain-containing protein [Reichenbachiella versicolor]|uniref:DUF6973 domain-containing protein n=1 Tax=Reichenbachiella versicolor TaxID=1821036 RepID=UPI000D6E2B71|nr:hypothetical protein [Reichenbachiella versicolor]